MGTHIGKYFFEDDLSEMEIEKLDALAGACKFYKMQKLRKQLIDEFADFNLRAHALGFDLCWVNPDNPDEKQVLNWLNFCPLTRETLPNGSH